MTFQAALEKALKDHKDRVWFDVIHDLDELIREINDIVYIKTEGKLGIGLVISGGKKFDLLLVRDKRQKIVARLERISVASVDGKPTYPVFIHVGSEMQIPLVNQAALRDRLMLHFTTANGALVTAVAETLAKKKNPA